MRRCGDDESWEDLSTFEQVEVIPKYQVGDKVRFSYLSEEKDGQIQAIECHYNITRPFYQILVLEENCLYKNVSEANIQGIL